MSSRLRKIFLVNAKVSGSTTSGLISEIDPRGGAAIIGGNGAGKTTTLQVIALFFGYSPSQLVQTGENRESMLRFMLPHPESAIVFEYERGSDPADVCHVILRREANSDAGEYRFVRGPLREELLKAQDASGDTIFLDDEGTRQVAVRLGLGDDFAPKISLAAYRSVILNVPSAGKAAKGNTNRSYLSQRFSFSRKRLTHLDRLVAAVIKEHLDFDDFAEVAATIVMEKIAPGQHGMSKDTQLQLRQDRSQIDQWLRDRDAVERALKLKPEVTQLRQLIADFRALDIRLGQMRSDCTRLKSLKEELKESAEKEQRSLSERRGKLQEEFDFKKTQLEQAIDTARQTSSDRANEYDVLRKKKEYLVEGEASQWAEKDLGLAGLRGESHSLQEIIQTIHNTAAGVANDYAEKIRSVERETTRTVDVMQKEHGKVGKLYDEELVALQTQENQLLSEIEDQSKSRIEAANTQLEECIAAEANAKYQVQHPTIEEDWENQLEHIRQVHEDHQTEVIAAQNAHASAQSAFNEADRHWQKAQQLFESQKEHLAKAVKAVESIKAQMRPDPQSLLATLHGNEDSSWTETLAKVIDPSLLGRTDLQPHFTGEAEALLYGWGLNLESIARPTWVDQEDLHRQLEEASRAAETSQGDLDEASARFNSAAQQRDLAITHLNLQEAALNVVRSKGKEILSQLNATKSRVANAREQAKETAAYKLRTATDALTKARRKATELKTQWENERRSKREEFVQQREQAKLRRDRAAAKVNKEIEDFKAVQSGAIKNLEKDREKDLAEQGVDVEDLTRKEKTLGGLRTQIRDIEDHGPIIREWKEWQENQGPSKLVEAQDSKKRAAAHLKQAQDDLTLAEQAQRQVNADFGQKESSIRGSIANTESELLVLKSFSTELEKFAPMGVSNVTVDNIAGDLKGKVLALLESHGEKKKELKTTSDRVERILCESESSTREFVNGVMREAGANALDVDRADALVRVYDRIPREVLTNVNTSLRTMLDGIRHYRETISDFEKEVKEFNNKLQEGLQLVSSSFERFTDFKVNVVTNLDKIDFVGKLKLLDDVIADHRARNIATYSIEVPPVQASHALRKFMEALSSGSMGVDLGKQITLSGSVKDGGILKQFHSAKDLAKISSNGLTAIALISLLSGLLNVIRGKEEIYIPWATDEVGRFDGPNFKHLMQMMAENKIDAVTASPALTPASYAFFANRYIVEADSVIAVYRPRQRAPSNLQTPN